MSDVARFDFCQGQENLLLEIISQERAPVYGKTGLPSIQRKGDCLNLLCLNAFTGSRILKRL